MTDQHKDFTKDFQKAFFQHLNKNYRPHSYYVAMTARAMLADLADHALTEADIENPELRMAIYGRSEIFKDVLAWMSAMIEIKECIDIRERA